MTSILSLDYESSIEDYCDTYHFGRHLGCIEISRQLLQDNVVTLDQLSSNILYDENEIQMLEQFYQNKNYDYDYPLPNDFYEISQIRDGDGSQIRDGYFSEIADTLYILCQNNVIDMHTAYDYYKGTRP